jgi:hypothetical protein
MPDALLADPGSNPEIPKPPNARTQRGCVSGTPFRPAPLSFRDTEHRKVWARTEATSNQPTPEIATVHQDEGGDGGPHRTRGQLQTMPC